MKKVLIYTLLMLAVATVQSCKEDEEPEIPPTLELKAGAGYTTADAEVAKSTTLKVGVVATKTEDDLKTFNVSVAFDGASTTTSLQTENIPAASKTLYDADVTITTRDVAGTEKWYFTITDVDGNIVQKTITLTVK